MPSDDEDDDPESVERCGNNFAHGLCHGRLHQRVRKRLRHGTSDHPNCADNLKTFRETHGEKKELVLMKETPSQRQNRLEKQRERTANNRKKETPQEKNIRKEKDRVRAKLRRNCHSLDVEERDKLESQLNMLSTARYVANWWPESTAQKKDRLKIDNERHEESKLVVRFVHRATNIIAPRMAELEKELAALKQKKPVDSWSVEVCEGELFQLDWELSVFQKRFSLCLEPRHRPEFICMKPKDNNEVKLVRLQKLHSQKEWGLEHISLLITLSSGWSGKEKVGLQWNNSLHQMFPVPLRHMEAFIILDCGLCMLEKEKSKLCDHMRRMEFQAREDGVFCRLNEFHLRCLERSRQTRAEARDCQTTQRRRQKKHQCKTHLKTQERRHANGSKPCLKIHAFTEL